MNEWDSRRFGDLYLEPSRNGISVSKSLRGDGYPMVNMKELFAYDIVTDQHGELVPLTDSELSRWSLTDGDLLFGRRSLVLAGAGKVSLVKDPPTGTVFESSIIRSRLDRSVALPEFYFYFFRSGPGRQLMETIVEQTAVAGIRSSDLAGLTVPVPALPEQRRIAAVLSSLDDLIEHNRAQSDVMNELWRSVVLSHIGTDGEVKLSDLARFVNGRNFTKDASEVGVPVIRTPEVRNGPSANTIRSEVRANEDNIARLGDILFVWSGSLLVDRWAYEPGLVNQHIFKVLPNDGVPPWLALWAIEKLMVDFLGVAADKATTMGHIKREDLGRRVNAPPRSIWSELDATVKPLYDLSMDLQAEINDLSRTRNELLPLLMSGAIRVDDALEASA